MGSLRGVVSTLRYRIATRAPLTVTEEEPRVQIMTLHSAKGLEGQNIIIAGAADQLVPGMTTDMAAKAEQRRLLYVAVTRARESLIVSWSRTVKYADAIANHIRTSDGIVTQDGQPVVRLSRTTLLPQALPGGVDGAAWLSEVTAPEA